MLKYVQPASGRRALAALSCISVTMACSPSNDSDGNETSSSSDTARRVCKAPNGVNIRRPASNGGLAETGKLAYDNARLTLMGGSQNARLGGELHTFVWVKFQDQSTGWISTNYVCHLPSGSTARSTGNSCGRTNIGTVMGAFLDTVAYAEVGSRGHCDGYNIKQGFGTFSSYADHPREIVTAGGYSSDAAGRYQFLSTSWDDFAGKLGLRDFSPANQDRAALQYLSELGVNSRTLSNNRTSFNAALDKIAGTWCSISGTPRYSCSGQPAKGQSELWNVFQARLNSR